MKDNKSLFGIIGIVIGSIALLLSLIHFWAGPFSPKPTIESVVAEKTASIRKAAIDALKGKKPEKKTFVSKWDADKGTDVITALFGGIAIILGVIGFAKREPNRVAGGATALGISAVAFQFIAMYAMAMLVVLLICAALSGLGLG